MTVIWCFGFLPQRQHATIKKTKTQTYLLQALYYITLMSLNTHTMAGDLFHLLTYKLFAQRTFQHVDQYETTWAFSCPKSLDNFNNTSMVSCSSNCPHRNLKSTRVYFSNNIIYASSESVIETFRLTWGACVHWSNIINISTERLNDVRCSDKCGSQNI